MKKLSIILLCLACTQPAWSQSLVGSSPGFHYFNRADATIEDHDAVVIECLLATRALIQPDPPSAAMNGGLLGALIGGIVEGVINGNEERQGRAANVESCMAIMGWSVFGLTDEQGREIEALEEPELISGALAARMGVIDQDQLLRGPFANELARGPFAIGEATDLKEVSLSVRSVRDRIDVAMEAAGELKPPEKPKGYNTPKALKSIDDEELGLANPERAHLVVRVTGDPTLVTYTGLLFQRLDAYGDEAVFDGNATLYSTLTKRSVSKKVKGVRTSDYIVEVPDGLWKLAAIQYLGGFDADLCFGAPAFHVSDGQTVFVGKLTLNYGEGYPIDNSDPKDATAALALAPQLLDSLVTAEFVNGYESDCFGAYGYAYEMEGAPFLGSAAMEIATDETGALTGDMQSEGAAISEVESADESGDQFEAFDEPDAEEADASLEMNPVGG